MATPKFTVGICGGGIAGLATAIALTHFMNESQPIKVDVYESAAKFTEIGAGIGFWPRPWNILKKLGCADALEKLLEQRPQDSLLQHAMEYRKSDFKEGISYYNLVVPCSVNAFRRAQFLDVLTTLVDKERVATHFSKRLTSYTQPESGDGPIELIFADGSSAKVDLLIGCDGIHSPVRHILMKSIADQLEQSPNGDCAKQAEGIRNSAEARWSGTISYRTVIPRAKLEELAPQHRSFSRPVLYTGKDKHLITVPIAHKTLVNVAAFVAWPEKAGTFYEGKLAEEVSKDDLLQLFEGWEDEVQQVLQCIERPMSWVINEVDDLSSWTFGRVALAGDAAHAMTPHQASGAGQAIEDGYILSRLLAHPQTTLKTLPEALKVYDEIRRPFAREVREKSAASGRLYAFNESESMAIQDIGKGKEPSENDAGLLWNVGHSACDRWKWTWTTSISEDEERAVKILESRLANLQMSKQ